MSDFGKRATTAFRKQRHEGQTHWVPSNKNTWICRCSNAAKKQQNMLVVCLQVKADQFKVLYTFIHRQCDFRLCVHCHVKAT